MYFGFIEAFHLDIVLACIIHIAQRDKVSATKSVTSYLSIILVVIISLLLVAMYVFMAYTVERLSKSYKKHVVLDTKHMKDEKYRMWLEDKVAGGNRFQRHFNLVCLGKDIFNIVILYSLYYKVTVLVSLISVLQFGLLVCAIRWPPYLLRWMNFMLQGNNVLYMLLDIMFLVIIVGGQNISVNTRYYFVGFFMIGIVMIILLLNVGLPLFYTIRDLIKKCNRKNAKRKQEKVESFIFKDSEVKTFPRRLTKVYPSKILYPKLDTLENLNHAYNISKKVIPKAPKLKDDVPRKYWVRQAAKPEKLGRIPEKQELSLDMAAE
jgi:hypothetical protein